MMTWLGLFIVTVSLVLHAGALYDATTEESRLNAFKIWFRDNGGVVNGLDVADFEGMGRGILAASDIVPDQDVLFIPSHLIISANTIARSSDSDHQQLYKLFPDEQELITAFILLERAKDNDSFWKPYFDVLPDYVPNLGHCNADELDGLQHPPFANEVKRVNKKTRAAFQNFLIKTNEIWPTSAPARELDYMWAASIVDSRAFRFRGSINLVPFSDMFNYHPHEDKRQPNAGNFFLKHHKLSTTGLYVSADRACSKGEQLLEDYGDNMDKIYIQYHGFVPDLNPFRCVYLNPVPLGSIPRAQHRGNRVDEVGGVRELLELMDFRQTPSQCVDIRGTLGQSIEVYVTVLALSDSELADCFDVVSTSNKNWAMVFDMCGFKDISAYLGRLRDEDAETRSVMIAQEIANQSLRGRALEKIQSMIIEREKIFDTSIEEDDETLARLSAELKSLNENTVTSTSTAAQILRQINIVRYRFFNKKHVAQLRKMYSGSSDDSEKFVSASDIDEEAIEAAVMAAVADAVPLESDGISNLAGQWEANMLPDRDSRLALDLIRFNEWFQSEIKAPAVCKIEAKIIPGFRIGTVATEDISEEDIYLSVPKKMILDVNYVNDGRADPVLRKLFSDLEAKFGRRDDFHELLFTLLYEGFVKGSESFFWPYLRTIPSLDDLDVPLVWSEDRIRKRVGPSHLEKGQLEHRTQVLSFFRSISQIDLIRDFFPEGVFTEANYVWATAILDSRSIWWGGQRHIVPMLDFVNCNERLNDDSPLGRIHATTWGPIPGEKPKSQSFALTKSAWNLKKGQQLFENYGQPNHIYYTYHGFVLPNSEYDCVHFEISISEEEQKAIDFVKATKLLQILNLRRRKNDPRIPSIQFCLKADSGILDIPSYVWGYLVLKTNMYTTLSESSYDHPNTHTQRALFDLVQDHIKEYHVESPLDDHEVSKKFKSLEYQILLGWSENVKSSIFGNEEL